MSFSSSCSSKAVVRSFAVECCSRLALRPPPIRFTQGLMSGRPRKSRRTPATGEHEAIWQLSGQLLASGTRICWLGRDLRATSAPPLRCGKGHSVLANPEPGDSRLPRRGCAPSSSSRRRGLAAALGNRPAQGNEALDAVPQRARRDVERRQLSRHQPQRTVKGASLGQKPGRSGRAFSRGTGAPSASVRASMSNGIVVGDNAACRREPRPRRTR